MIFAMALPQYFHVQLEKMLQILNYVEFSMSAC